MSKLKIDYKESLLNAQKYIAQLEKENAELRRDKEDLIFVRNAKADHINELKAELTKKADTNHSLVEQMTRLEEENAELKGLRCCENCKNVNLQLHWRESEEIDKRRQFICGTCGNRKHWEYLGKTVGITETQQLIKATEIIKGLYFIIQSRIDYENNTGIADEMWRAKQFIKEIEK